MPTPSIALGCAGIAMARQSIALATGSRASIAALVAPTDLTLTPERIDEVMESLDEKFEWVEKAQGNMVAMRKAELDLLCELEVVRDLMQAAMKNRHDRSVLKECFGGDCWRIEWIRTLLETVQFSPMHANDQRPLTCTNACHSVEQVLQDLGFTDQLNEAHEKAAEMRRNKSEHSPDLSQVGVLKTGSSAKLEDEDEPLDEGPEDDVFAPLCVDVIRSEEPEEAPPSVAGMLWKKSPSALKLYIYQRRYVEVGDGKVCWWYCEEVKDGDPKGFLDFKTNPCIVDVDLNDDGRFTLKPKGEKWLAGNFTGADRGRELNFDAKECELDRGKWIEAIKEHISYGEGKFNSSG